MQVSKYYTIKNKIKSQSVGDSGTWPKNTVGQKIPCENIEL